VRFVALLVLALLPLAGCARSEERWALDLRSRDPFERALAALALARLDPRHGPRVAPVLLETVDRGELRLGDPARAALRRVAPHATEALVTALIVDPFATLERRAAIEGALVAAGPPAAATLVAALRGSGVRHAAALEPALLALGEAARGPLTEAAGESSEGQLAAWAAGLLRRLDARGAASR
jgi:hypothetical protein